MDIEGIKRFHEEIESSLLPYLREFDFNCEDWKINENEGSYNIKFKRNDKYISISFSTKSMDVVDGVSVIFYHGDFENVIGLPSLADDKKVWYNPYYPENMIEELKKYGKDFIKKD